MLSVYEALPAIERGCLDACRSGMTFRETAVYLGLPETRVRKAVLAAMNALSVARVG